jgi:protoheme IX farnesyltransferase
VAVAVVSLLLIPVNNMGVIYSAASLVLGVMFMVMTFRLGKTPTMSQAMRVFTFSITYLTLLFLAAMVDVLVR